MNHVKQILTVCVVVFAMGVSFWASPAAGGTVARWTFEEGVADTPAIGVGSVLESVNGLNGTPKDEPIYRSAITPDGSLGLEFDGIDDAVWVPDDPAIGLMLSVTLEAFISVDPFHPSAWDRRQIVSYGDDIPGLVSYYLALRDDDRRLVFHIGSGPDAAELVSPEPVPTGQLIHVAGTLDALTGRQKLYINGGGVSSDVTDALPFRLLALPYLSIGSYHILGPNDISCFDGVIADVRISDVALAPHEFIPEPATLSLLVLGGCALLCRRTKGISRDR